MLIVGTANTACGITEGMAVLRRGGTVEEAVEAALRHVEDNRGDDSVGLGGLPNLLGQVELDAAIMEGSHLRAGAVGALRGFRHPISVARRVMEELPHLLLVGEGAARFAQEIGAERGNPDTPEARHRYEERLRQAGLDPSRLGRPGGEPLRRALWQTVHSRPGGTANVIARDRQGRLCVGVTTSGWALKYPGRVGDSPIIGAGAYADDRYGAAACTGLGEVALRLCTAHSVVSRLSAGMSLEGAVRSALEDAVALDVGIPFVLHILALDRRGHHTFWSTAGQKASYLCLGPEDEEPRQLPARALAAP